jgi:hypothetical protein
VLLLSGDSLPPPPLNYFIFREGSGGGSEEEASHKAPHICLINACHTSLHNPNHPQKQKKNPERTRKLEKESTLPILFSIFFSSQPPPPMGWGTITVSHFHPPFSL